MLTLFSYPFYRMEKNKAQSNFTLLIVSEAIQIHRQAHCPGNRNKSK